VENGDFFGSCFSEFPQMLLAKLHGVFLKRYELNITEKKISTREKDAKAL
jgi:hypothetical protein